MKLFDLFATARRHLGDTVKPYLWKDATLAEYANEAEEEACRRARLIVDSTSRLCSISIVSGKPLVKLDDRIIFVRRAKLASSAIPIAKIHLADLDGRNPGWEAYSGLVSHYVPDHTTGYLRLFRVPTGADSLTLTVVRTPLKPMVEADDEPEINARYHRYLVHWMLHRAYLEQDTDTFDPERSARELGLFEAQFGPQSTAQDETWIGREHGYDDHEGLY